MKYFFTLIAALMLTISCSQSTSSDQGVVYDLVGVEFYNEFIPCVGGEDFTQENVAKICLLYTSPSPRDRTRSRMPSSA